MRKLCNDDIIVYPIARLTPLHSGLFPFIRPMADNWHALLLRIPGRHHFNCITDHRAMYEAILTTVRSKITNSSLY